MTDNGLGWHTRGHGGSRGPWGHQGAPRGFRGVWGNPGAKKSDKTAKQWLQTMVWSTQSVSWLERDGIYSFLRYLGPFGCIKTAIFSENANLSKTRFQEKNYTIASTDQLVQFLNGLAIFQRSWHTHGLWKIAKKPNPIVKFGCGSDCVKV